MRNKGFTLIELVIVMALLAIIAAIVVPMFLLTTDRARLRADVQSARVINNAMDLYRMERGRAVDYSPNVTTMEQIIDHLIYTGYINPRNINLQTAGADWYRRAATGAGNTAETMERVQVDITGSDPEIRNAAFQSLSRDERAYVRGGETTP